MCLLVYPWHHSVAIEGYYRACNFPQPCDDDDDGDLDCDLDGDDDKLAPLLKVS